MYLKTIKNFALALLLFTQSTYASLLTFNIEATDYFELSRSLDGSNETRVYTAISPTNFELSYDISFDDAPPSFTDESDSDGKHYSTFSNSFKVDLLTPVTPFSDELLALMPNPPTLSFTSGNFRSLVVSDLLTGEIIEEESYEQFDFTRNDVLPSNSDDDSIYFNQLNMRLMLPTIFTSVEANNYDLKELENMLLEREDLEVMFQESFATLYPGLSAVGYTGGGTYTIDVPEPSTLAIFSLALIGLASRRFKK